MCYVSVNCDQLLTGVFNFTLFSNLQGWMRLEKVEGCVGAALRWDTVAKEVTESLQQLFTEAESRED